MKRNVPALTKLTCVVFLLSVATTTAAANLKLVPTTPATNVLNGGVVTIDVMIDFSDVGGPLGGSFNLHFDGTALSVVGLDLNELAGEQDFFRLPNISSPFGPGQFKDWAVGAFDGLPDTLLLGTISFEIRPTMGLDTTITSTPTSGVGGPWISGSDYLTELTTSYNHLVITRTNGVGSVCGDSILYTGESCDDGNANAGDGCSATCTIEGGYDCTLPIPGDPPTPSICTVNFDTDGDGLTDQIDNCVLVSNVLQVDVDGDGIGNYCDPDFNNDCIVNFLDYSELIDQFLSTTTPLYDLNSNGVVNFNDIAIYAPFFLLPPGPGAANNVCQ